MLERICANESCTQLAAPQRKVCYKCQSKAWREKNPIKFMYNNLKKSAKKRGLPFTLTIEYFTQLAIDSGYHKNAGRHADGLTIDRIDNLRGYENDNIKVITKSENSRKYHSEDERRTDEGTILVLSDGDQNMPF